MINNHDMQPHMTRRKNTGVHDASMQFGSAAADHDMDYTIYRRSTGNTLDKLSLHVLARAYRSAWRVMYNCEPLGRHAIESLDLLIEFRG